MITLNVIFMNFIIAVISQSYSRIMDNVEAESYKQKAQMIQECDLHLTDKELTNPDYFPNFIIIRRPINTNEDDAD